MGSRPVVDEARPPLTVAAVDLGSNSFHMVIGRFVGPSLNVLDRMREPVRLAAALNSEGQLSVDGRRRAIACLERFGQRISSLTSEHVRAVGTNTLRRAHGAHEFRALSREALGHPIEVISGQEEARIIYSGVAHTHVVDGPRLVIDIGGGSTEVIVGEGFDVVQAHSLFMGCVDFSQAFFPGGSIRREQFRQAETAAGLEMQTAQASLRSVRWDLCSGASGTINAIEEILRLGGDGDGITLAGLKRLRKTMVSAGHTSKLDLPGLKKDRSHVLPGGLAILIGLFRSLEIESMTASAGALREGLLYDLVGRIRREDVRDRTIEQMIEQYQVDVGQAERVEKTALGLFEQLSAEFAGVADDLPRTVLSWAAHLHEIGLAVAHTGYHRHGAYLVGNSDMPGFSADDQQLLAVLVRAHRRRIPRAVTAEIAASRRELAQSLLVLFRLAVLLNRSRVPGLTPRVVWRDGERTLRLQFPSGWLGEHPLTVADLEQEAALVADLSVRLEFIET